MWGCVEGCVTEVGGVSWGWTEGGRCVWTVVTDEGSVFVEGGEAQGVGGE